MTDAHGLAAQLTYMQRKAVRRMGRGQSISKSQMNDPLIRELSSTDHYPAPPETYNMCEHADWVSHMHSAQPRLNSLGTRVLQALGEPT